MSELVAESSVKQLPKLDPNTVSFGWFIMCGALWEKLKRAAHSDWLSMVMPSVFTKTFGRTLMVLNVIHFTTAADFILQNLMFAAWPIALISGSVVGAYRYFEARGNEKSKEDSFWIGASFFIKTAVKFFVVYMGWASAMALVNAMGWFSAPITLPALIILGSAAGGLALFSLTRWLLGKFKANEWAINIAEVLMVASVFAIVAAAAYFLSPLVMALLVVGGITAISLFFASLLTDVLPDPERNFSRAWGMLARAYTEGAVWAFVEHIGLNVVVGGVLGGVLDVFCVCTAVCMAIFVGGQIDEHFKYLRGSQMEKVKEENKERITQEIGEIKDPTKTVENWSDLSLSIDSLREKLPKDALNDFDAHIKVLLGLKILHLLDAVAMGKKTATDVDTLIPDKCLEFVVARRVFFISLAYGAATCSLLQRAKNVVKQCLQNPKDTGKKAEWEALRDSWKDDLSKEHERTQTTLEDNYKIGIFSRSQASGPVEQSQSVLVSVY